VRVPSVVGRTEADAQAALRAAGFTVRVAPEQVPSSVPAGSVASTAPAGGASTSRGGIVTLTLSNGQAA
jgi:beta-lactam-binding protein with PASTA domain